LLIDSLRLYSTNVEFLEGNNPYLFSSNGHRVYIKISNVHASGKNRPNADECRIQVSKSDGFRSALNSKTDVLVLGYYVDDNVFTAWDPVRMRPRYNQKETISLYSRFRIQNEAQNNGIALYIDNDPEQPQHVITFKPDYLGLYLENFKTIHGLNLDELKTLVEASDSMPESDSEQPIKVGERVYVVNHGRAHRDHRFRRDVNEAYNFKCAMCGIGLNLVEAAHIIPHAHNDGTDDISNGVCLCTLHHKAYDNGLIYFDVDFKIKINKSKIKYLTKINRDSGFCTLHDLTFKELLLPMSISLKPAGENINTANKIRGII